MDKHTQGRWIRSEMRRGNYGTPSEKWEVVPIVIATCGLPDGNGPNARICELTVGESAFRIGKVNGSHHTVSIEEARANADLVAAAPQLLTALEELLAEYQEIHGALMDSRSVACHHARAAVLKARGRGIGGLLARAPI